MQPARGFRHSDTARIITRTGNIAGGVALASAFGITPGLLGGILRGAVMGRTLSQIEPLSKDISNKLMQSKRPRIKKIGKLLGQTGRERGVALSKRGLRSRNRLIRGLSRGNLRLDKWLYEPRVTQSGQIVNRNMIGHRAWNIARRILEQIRGARSQKLFT